MPTNKISSNEPAAQASVGDRIRSLRHQRGYSLRILAERSGLNINTLSLIEKEKSSPSVSTLQRLAGALSVPIIAFFESPTEKKPISFLPVSQQKTTDINGTSLINLNKELSEEEFQPFLITLQPGAGSGPAPIVHTGIEFVYCLKGSVLYTVENETYQLEVGDSLIFEAHLQHSWENAHDGLTQLLLVMTPAQKRETFGGRHFGYSSA
ncbi:MAG: cupin domain-containing protein [Anaerolineaceae bacterium]|nr:cupin domain-containing protein [Anaerolineaceae bacterium]